jgi:hypothetical protein
LRLLGVFEVVTRVFEVVTGVSEVVTGVFEVVTGSWGCLGVFDVVRGM